MYTVFISANSQDYEQADYVHTFLRGNGVKAFFCKHSLGEMGNSKYRKSIDQALDVCSHFVLVTSSAANTKSKWVEYEMDKFLDLKIERGGNFVTVRTCHFDVQELGSSIRHNEIIEYSKLEKLLPYVRTEGNAFDGSKNVRIYPSGAILCSLVSLLFSAVGAFILPAGIVAIVFGALALGKLKVMPGSNAWRWAAKAGIAVGIIEVIVILGALVEGFNRAPNS
jgi:TIR domain